VNTSSIEAPVNDLCSNAQVVVPGRNATIFGSTAGALYDSYEDACSGLSDSRDRWYKVTGNGARMLASVCNPETNFDSQPSIYSSIEADGSCSNMESVATNDEACGGSASQHKIYIQIV
jgi:hypothetical protein